MTDSNHLWSSPPANLELSSADVHVWRASLDQPAACVQRLAQVLSADERRRAERFHFERDRSRFTIGCGILRTILGRYLGLDPSRLHFCYSSYGKPLLARGSGGGTLCFNVSHSQGIALYAITFAREIGVDVEYIRPIAEDDQIAEQFFSTREATMLRALPMSQKQRAFFNCWTRKEAYLKAKGRGLDQLHGVEVLLIPGEEAELLSIAGDSREASRWFIQTLSPAPGYVAALVVEKHGSLPPSSWQFKYWDFSM